ncbi:MmcB family DNA repair protein [Paenibacillus aestuarii]|uniref:MmcB family DNA repair protein n=1 Tax=Paenibacillus aestuarii TaxID=516965 RepID=A0ABW0K8G1_9BACL
MPAHTCKKLISLGLKALHLAPLFKAGDWEGLSDILSSVNDDTKRNELPMLMQLLSEKRSRISEFQSEVHTRLRSLEERELKVEELEQELKQTQLRIEEETLYLSKYSDEARVFLINHLGVYNQQLVLARRLDSLWQRSLKKKKVLEYDEWNYIWHIRDLDQLVEEYLKRVQRKNPYPTEWNIEKEDKRNQNSWYTTPMSAEYRLPEGLAKDLRSSFEDIKGQMKAIETEREEIKLEMKRLRKTSPKSFMESIEASNILSAHELKAHGEMQDKALKWLFNRGNIVASEVTLPNGRRADVIGYDEAGRIIIIEVKVSSADFQRDEKWFA